MMNARIIDPTKVVRLALQGAASIAGLLITTEAMIADRPDGARRQRQLAWKSRTIRPRHKDRHDRATAGEEERGSR